MTGALRAILVAGAVVLAFAAALVLLIWWRQEQLIFQPSGPPFPTAPGTRRVTYRADDGQDLFALVVTPDSVPPRGYLIAFHGNADLAAWQVSWASEIARRTGWGVVLSEYRGYGGLTGAPTVEGTRRDAKATLEYVTRELDVPEGRLAYFGHSLGSAIATELTAETRPRVLILQSPFTSARDMARIVVARPVELVWGVISRVHYDTEARVRALEVPVWVAHGTRDAIVPVRMGRQVFDAARVKGELLIVEGAGHNDVSDIAGEAYWMWITGALETDR